MKAVYSRFCCQLRELGEFQQWTMPNGKPACNGKSMREALAELGEGSASDILNLRAIIATTVPQQTAAIALLEKEKFLPVFKWISHYNGKEITLWARPPNRQPVTGKS
jgi:hypothetical protein